MSHNKNHLSKALNTSKSSQSFSFKSKSTLIPVIFFTSITLSSYFQRIICQNYLSLSEKILGFSTITQDSEKLTVLKQSMLYISFFEFFIAFIIMNLRIIGQKISPVAEKDPLSISLLNRILSNNLQQSFVFFGLYSYLLFGTTELEEKYIFSLPLIFLIGRIFYTIGYILGTITGIPTYRSFGFAFSVSVNAFMILELILNLSDIYRVFLFA